MPIVDDITGIYVGADAVTKAYVGEDVVFTSSSSPLDFTWRGAWLADDIGLSNGATVTTWPALATSTQGDITGWAGNAADSVLYSTTGMGGQPELQVVASRNVTHDVIDWGSTLAQPNTIVLVVRSPTTTTDFVDTSPTTNRHLIDGASGLRMFAGTALTDNPTDAFDDSPHLLIATFNGGSSSMRVDGVQVSSGNAGTQGMGPMILWSGTFQSSAVKFAFVGVYTSAMSVDEIATTETFFMSKYGIT